MSITMFTTLKKESTINEVNLENCCSIFFSYYLLTSSNFVGMREYCGDALI